MPQRVNIAQALDLAVQHHNAGRLSEAEDIYEQILAAVPDNHDALHLLGLIANERGENERAAELIKRALDIAPDVAGMHGNLALVLQDLGRSEEAAERFQRALALDPNFAEGHNNLGLVLQDLGRLDDAIGSFERALKINPQFAEAHSNLGNLQKMQGRLEDAAGSHRKAIEMAPDFADAHNNLGGVRHEQGRSEDAVACYQSALSLDPGLAHAHANLGIVLTESGDLEEALTRLRKAIALSPETASFWTGLAACVERISFDAADDDLFEDLLRLLDHPAIDPQSITPAVLSALRQHSEFADVLARSPNIDLSDTATLSAIPLLLRALVLSPFKDLQVEAMLTALRRDLLDAALSASQGESELEFSCALAQHCFLNEYVFPVTDEESAAVIRLEGEIGDNPQIDNVPAMGISVLAAYRPLSDFEWAVRLEASNWPDIVQDVIAQQVADPLEKRGSREAIPQLTAIEGDVSKSVRAQYEENPYPRWTTFASRHQPTPIGDVLRGAPLRFALEGYQTTDRPDILIAGCGTGQQSLLAASRFASAQILAIDLSLASLSYAMLKTRECGIESIEYAQADIMALDGLEKRFDLIECVGVLHHLGDPLAGWRILVGLLKPGGVMKIGLYSETARQDVVTARSLIAERGYNATPKGIRRCREAIAALARDGDDMMASITERNSFFTASECRDLMFHVQEHRFTLPQIETALQTLGLDFLGFEMRDQAAMRRFKELHSEALTDLDRWHTFELDNPDTFRGMYQFWVRKRCPS